MNLYNFHEKSDDLKGHEERHDRVIDLVWKQIEKNGRATSQQEDLIAKNAAFSYYYARDVLNKGRWPKGEDAIVKDAHYSYLYARDVLNKERFLKGEDAISKDPFYSYWYAKDIIKGRFPKGEKIIAKDAASHCQYEKEFGIRLEIN